MAVSGLLQTALIFHQLSLLGERGLTTAQAAANFLPQTAAGIAATLLVGVVIDRLAHPQLLLLASMVLLTGGLAWATTVTPGWSAIGYGATIGAAASAIRAIEAALTPRMFGTAHLAAIRGVLTAVGVGSTAAGPLLFAIGREWTGSYTAILLGSTALPVAVAITAIMTRLPARTSH